MIERVMQYLQGLEPRERRMVVFGAVAALLLLIIAIVLPLQRSVSAVQQRVERKRDDLQWLRSMAPQLAGLQGSVPPPLRESLVVVMRERYGVRVDSATIDAAKGGGNVTATLVLHAG